MVTGNDNGDAHRANSSLKVLDEKIPDNAKENIMLTTSACSMGKDSPLPTVPVATLVDSMSKVICEDSRPIQRDSKGVSKKSESNPALVGLKKELGLLNGIGILVGIMIGSGIFVSPGTVIAYSGSVGMSLIVWVVSGFMCMAGALCYAELGTTILENGGSYIYIREIFGSVPAFLTLWLGITIAVPCSKAISAITFATYLLQPIFPNCAAPPYVAVRLIAATMLCLIAYINVKKVRLGAKVHNAFALLKVLALVIIIITGATYLGTGHTENFRNPMEGTISSSTSIATAFYSTLYSYTGWDDLNVVTGELKDPAKNLPRAIAISLVSVIAIYTLTNMAYFAVLTPNEIVSSSAVAVTFGSRTLGSIVWIISLFVACSTFGNANAGTMTYSRIIHAGSRMGLLPRFLRLIHIDNCTPITSAISSVIIPLLLLLAPDIGTLLTYTSFAKNLTDILVVLSLLWLRYQEPDRPRPVKVWIVVPIIYLALALFVAIFPVVQRPVEIGVAVGIYLSGLLVYYFTIHLKIQVISDAVDQVTYFCQMFFLCCEEEKEEMMLKSS